MRDKSQVVLPLDLGISIPEGDFVFIEMLEAFLSKKSEYFSHLGKFGDRSSFFKTDVDATFMHMKED